MEVAKINFLKCHTHPHQQESTVVTTCVGWYLIFDDEFVLIVTIPTQQIPRGTDLDWSVWCQTNTPRRFFWWDGWTNENILFKHVSVNIPSAMLRCPECIELIPQRSIPPFPTLTSLVGRTRMGINWCLHSCLVVYLSLPLSSSVPGVCNKHPWGTIIRCLVFRMKSFSLGNRIK